MNKKVLSLFSKSDRAFFLDSEMKILYHENKLQSVSERKVENLQIQKGNEGKAITIYDIAKEAGVSASTVSRVLTNNANVRPAKREKVLELIRKYNFKPNALAKGLADTKSKTIGILAADVRNPYYAALFVACEKVAREAGYTVLLCNSLGDHKQEEILLEKLREQRVGAIIQFGGEVDDLTSDMDYVEIVNQIMATTPVVVTGKLDGTQCHMVRIDAMKTMDLLMEHLISLNHRRIAMVGGRADVLSTVEKFQRYKQILKENMIEFDPDLVKMYGANEKGGYDQTSGYNQMNQLMAEGKKPTAVIAINEFAAFGVIRSAWEHGLRIPEDISIVSYDNTYMAEMLVPRLTSVDYNYDDFGRRLVETAIALIEERPAERLQMVNPTLVARESSAVASNY